jgi:hypothetical protein
MKVYLVNAHGVVFKKREDAIAFVREKEYNEKELAYFDRVFNAKYSEETILYLINARIWEMELQ